MRRLNRFQLFLYNAGGIIMLLGISLPIFLSDPSPAPYVYTVGALLFGLMQLRQTYSGKALTIRRLLHLRLIGILALWATAALMFLSLYSVGNIGGREWQMAFAIGAVFEVYTAFRLPAEVEKEERMAARGK